MTILSAWPSLNTWSCTRKRLHLDIAGNWDVGSLSNAVCAAEHLQAFSFLCKFNGSDRFFMLTSTTAAHGQISLEFEKYPMAACRYCTCTNVLDDA